MQASYRLEVSNFGPIVEAGVELRPLTVFVGPSNTGKSYLATLIYALHRCFGSITLEPPGLSPQRFRHWSVDYPYIEKFRRDTAAWQGLKDWVTGITETIETSGKDRHGDASPLPPLPPELSSHLYPVLKSTSLFNHLIESELRRCFGASAVDVLIRQRNTTGKDGEAAISVICPKQASMDAGARFHLFLKEGRSKINGGVEVASPVSLTLDDNLGLPRWVVESVAHLVNEREVSDEQIKRVLEYFTVLLFQSWFHPINRIAYYLPADRTGIMHSHQVVVSTLVQNAATAGRRPATDSPALSGVLADFLGQLIEMSNPRNGHNPDSFKKSATSIESAILKGAVRLQEAETGYPVFTYRPRRWKTDLPLMRVSSMVAELAPVVLYLRYVVQAGNTLIIEEPEAHLHPAMQAEFTRQLALLVRAGVKLVVTTHSEWILEELANIVRRSEIPASDRKEIPRQEFSLKAEQVGVWLFEPQRRPQGSVVKEIPLDTSGLYPTRFDEVALTLHNDWADISSMVGDNA